MNSLIPLNKDLQLQKYSLHDFKQITQRVLEYLPNVLSGFNEKKGYKIHSSQSAGTTKYLRPINQRLFIYSSSMFLSKFNDFYKLINKLKQKGESWSSIDKTLIDSVLYTIQQSIGAGFDLLSHPNSARKHVGNRFEELIKALLTEMCIANKKIILQIPYETEEGTKIYKSENDLIISPYNEVKSTNQTLDENEVVISIKTTSKDRMIKMFGDKLLLEKFVNHKQKVVGIFLNDVQRKESDNISFTLVSGLFMVYTKFLVELEGVYYLDPPPNALKEPYNKHMKPFSDFLTNDIWKLLAS